MILQADCREAMPIFGPYDLIIADPPYGDTTLAWDRIVQGWEAVALDNLGPGGSMWVFGSLRYFMAVGIPKGWRVAQDIVWEKPNGSGFAKDRFRRVHEHVVQLYPESAPWAAVYNDVQRVPRTGPDKTGAVHGQPAHTGKFKPVAYIDDGLRLPVAYIDDGLRLPRSVQKHPQVRHVGRHPTEKPVSLLEALIHTSCRPGGLVGDFFAGSGAAGEAARNCGRRYVGCEIDPILASTAENRLTSRPNRF